MNIPCIASFKPASALLLLSEQGKQAGIGKPLDEVEVKRLIEDRKRSNEERATREP